MRFVMMVKNTGESLATYEAGGHPDVELVKAMMKFNEELLATGALISLDGLHPSSRGAKVTFEKGKKPVIVDGPFTEAKEMIGGFWITRFPSKQAALELVARCPIPDGEIEVREIFDMGERPADIREATAEFAQKLGKQRQ